jgi:PAS domain S-box-containing protein
MRATAHTQSPLSRGQTFVICAALMLTILAYGLTSKSFPWIFAFHFNPYALTSLAALVTDIVICFLVVRIGAKTDDVYWLGANFAILAGVAVAETFCRLGATPATTAFWFPVSSMFTYFSPALFFMFALSYTHPNLSRHVGTIVTLLVAAISISFLDLTTGLFNNYGVILPTPWGGANPTEPLYNILTVWVLVLYITSLVMMFNFSRRTLNPRLKRQSRIFYIACAIPIVFGTFTDGVLPGLGIQALPLGTLFVALAGAIITYGALRYRLLELTPAVIAGSILDTMNEAVIGIAGDFSIHYANRGAEHMLGYKSSEFAKLHFFQFLTDEWTENKLRASLLDPLATKPVVELDDIDFHTASGVLLTAKLSISQVTQGEPGDGYIIVMTDITKLARTTEVIEREVKVRTKELRVAQEKLLETDKLKTEFVRLTSHNLRTPLAIVSGNLRMLREPSLSDEQKISCLEGAETNSQKLRELVEDLLTINHIEAGDKLERESVPAMSILGPPAAEAARLATARNNAFDTNIRIGKARLSANASRLRAAIHNILDNAIKYTSDGGGIAEAEIQKLFTKFHRATDTLDYNYEGEGIGLYLTKLIIEDHGGTIHIESTARAREAGSLSDPAGQHVRKAGRLVGHGPGSGTTVTVSLPLAE